MACTILIPTCKPPRAEQIEAIHANTDDATVIVSSLNDSASVNRNWCLMGCTDDVAIMLDDDISGFYRGWEDDLLSPMADPDVVMVSARLMNPDGSVGPTCSRCYRLEPDAIEIEPSDHCVLPTAAIAFRNCGIRFDEGFIGSGWEDNDWCFEYLKRFPSAKFVQSNKCRLIHANEQKNQGDKFWIHNQMHFMKKWGAICESS